MTRAIVGRLRPLAVTSGQRVRALPDVPTIAQAPFLLVTTPSLRVDSVKDLIAAAKAKPGALNFSSSGQGGSGHMAGELFKRMSDIRVDHVSFRGGAPALQAPAPRDDTPGCHCEERPRRSNPGDPRNDS